MRARANASVCVSVRVCTSNNSFTSIIIHRRKRGRPTACDGKEGKTVA